jgi:hypothetical protein
MTSKIEAAVKRAQLGKSWVLQAPGSHRPDAAGFLRYRGWISGLPEFGEYRAMGYVE